MCIIIASDKGKTIPIEHIENGWSENSDGGGYMYSCNNEVIIKKGFMKLKELLKSYEKDKKEHDSTFVVHLRKVSRGPKNKENCHPFYTHENKIGLVHNGTIHHIAIDNKKSDSFQLAKMISKWDETWTENKYLQILLNKFIYPGKMIVLTPKELWYYGEFEIIDGLYYSNRSYMEKQKTLPFNKKNDMYYEPYEFDSLNQGKYDNKKIIYCKTCKIELIYKIERDCGLCYSCRNTEDLKRYEDFTHMA